MTTIALAQLVDWVPAFLSRLGHGFSDFLKGIDEARVMAHRFKELSQMSDGQLAARGLKREDIPQAVLRTKAR
jgi:hypothetical protein